jgi:hypothetical protein
MIRDAVRAALVVAVAAALASILVEARQRLAIIDLAHRATAVGPPIAAMPAPAGQPGYGQPGYGQPEAGPLRRFGRATLDLADAALGVVR